MNSNILVRILTEWKGSQQLKNAGKDLNAFEATAAKLGKTLGTAFAGYKIIGFANASLKAFTADNLAAKQLALTLQNLGLGFDSKRVEDYIQATEKLSGVLDDQLRPAMQLFLNTTGSVDRSTKMLNTALNISRATGKDLISVSTALSRAYQGNYTSLQRLGIGVNVATMKTQGFAAVQDQLNNKFAGAAKVAAESYQGSLDKLKVAADNAKESIGKGMVDALKALSAGGTIDSAVAGIDNLAKRIGNAVGAMGRFIAFTKLTLTSLHAPSQEAIQAIYGIPGAGSPQTRGAGRIAVESALARAAAEKKVADQLAAQAKAAKSTFDSSKAQLALKKAQATFDQQAIEIAAALQNNKLTAEERLRLQMMSTADQLQAAIQDQNQAAVDKLTKSLTDLQTAFASLSKWNPFEAATTGALNAAKAFGLALAAYLAYRAGERGDTPLPTGTLPTGFNPYPTVPTPSTTGINPNTGADTNGNKPLIVNVTIDGKDVAAAVTDTVTGTQQTNSQAGIQPFWARNNVPNAGQW